jgi:hypothetical protein
VGSPSALRAQSRDWVFAAQHSVQADGTYNWAPPPTLHPRGVIGLPSPTRTQNRIPAGCSRLIRRRYAVGRRLPEQSCSIGASPPNCLKPSADCKPIAHGAVIGSSAEHSVKGAPAATVPGYLPARDRVYIKTGSMPRFRLNEAKRLALAATVLGLCTSVPDPIETPWPEFDILRRVADRPVSEVKLNFDCRRRRFSRHWGTG